MVVLAFITKWDPILHGISSNEVSYIKYMKTKDLIISTIWDKPYDNETFEQIISWFYKYNLDSILSGTNIIKLCIIKSYRYKKRDFAIQHFGINKFQKLWKKYYAKKLIFMKSIRNLKHREIHGKYPNKF